MPTDHRPSESSRVAARLRDDIVAGVRRPGDRLVERDLAAEWGVSRVPVRDALKALESEGLVTLRPHTWAVVREFGEQDLAELAQVRQALEPMTFRLAAVRHTPEQLAALGAVLEREQACAAASDAPGARRAAADFHELVTELAGHALLSEVGTLLSARMRWFLAQHDDVVTVAEEHAALFEAIAVRDLARLEVLIADHVDQARGA